MGQQWDGSGIERDPEFWRLVHDILLPGGFCLAFSGARTGHWQAVAMEQAGFIMHPMTGWVFGSGFPKAKDAGEAGADWEGWKFGAASLKPALEPIYFAQRPFSEKTGLANLRKHGVGALNINGCRVPTDESTIRTSNQRMRSKGKPGSAYASDGYVPGPHRTSGSDEGRYPANLLHDGSEQAQSVFPDSSERFFNAFPVEPEAVYYHSKASTKDRVFQCSICGEHGVGIKPGCECIDNHGNRKLRGHPTVKPIGLMRHLVRLVTPPGGTVLDPFAGTGTTAAAAMAEGFDCILIEGQAEYAEDIRARLEILPRKGTLSYNLDDLL
jgi:site-specific DNA-methyltransferase (adenine-specific)